MKNASSPNRVCSNSRLLLGFLVILLSGCALLAGFGAISKSFAARIGSPQAYRVLPQRCVLKTMSHPMLAWHGESTSKEIGYLACHSCRCTGETFVQSDPLGVEIGPRLDRRAATYSMLLFRLLIPISPWLASHLVAASAVRFTVLATEATRGRRWQLWTALVSSISNSRQTALPTSVPRTVSGKARTAV